MLIEVAANNFWEINIGHVITFVSLLTSFWVAHAANVNRIKKSAAEMQDMKTKIDMMYDWFCTTVFGSGKRPGAPPSGGPPSGGAAAA